MGNEFIEWAEVFFSRGSENLDKLLSKQEVKTQFDPKNKFSSKGFTARLRAFCVNAEHIDCLNPSECRGFEPSGKRIIRKVYGVTKEFIYVRTPGTPINNEIEGA